MWHFHSFSVEVEDRAKGWWVFLLREDKLVCITHCPKLKEEGMRAKKKKESTKYCDLSKKRKLQYIFTAYI